MKTYAHYITTPARLPALLKKFENKPHDVTYNSLSDTFAVRVQIDEDYYDYCIRILADIRDDYDPKDDTYNALNEGISALKTIQDMQTKGE